MKPSDVVNTTEGPSLAKLLEAESPGPFTLRRRWVVAVVILAIAAVAAFLVLRSGDRSAGPRYSAEAVTMGRLVVRVSATGNLQPTNKVDVSSELSGIVSEVLVDENDRVKKGQALARLDLSRLKDAVTKSRATLAASEAQVLQAGATVEEARAQLTRFEQVAELSGGKVPSGSEMATAEANLKRAEASDANARASVTQARANLRSDETNLGAGRAVCVIGETVRQKLFGRQNPVGSDIRLKGFACEVIGLLKGKGQAAMGQDQDDAVVMPLRSAQRRLTGSQDIGRIMVSVARGASMDAAKLHLTSLLRERRRIGENEDDDFRVMDTRQLAETLTGTTRILTMLLGAVAAVSLLVGGIGIMNIMLVSVTERTREIGIRLAIGAFEREVLLQFLIEAVVLSGLGGLIGIALATGASIGLARLMGVPYLFDPGINLVSFLFSAAIGVVFGFFPARRAAGLNPIDALRYE